MKICVVYLHSSIVKHGSGKSLEGGKDGCTTMDDFFPELGGVVVLVLAISCALDDFLALFCLIVPIPSGHTVTVVWPTAT